MCTAAPGSKVRKWSGGSAAARSSTDIAIYALVFRDRAPPPPPAAAAGIRYTYHRARYTIRGL